MSCDLGLQSIDLGVWPLALGTMHQSLFAKRHLRVAFLFIAERRSTKGGMTVRAPAGGVAGCPWFRVTEHGAIFSAHSAFWGIQVFFFFFNSLEKIPRNGDYWTLWHGPKYIKLIFQP